MGVDMQIYIGPSRAQHKLWGTVLAILCGCALPISALAQSTVQYIHTDALGSPIAITDSAGNLVEQSAFDPYGQSLGQAPMDAPGFTGHVSDSATSLTYMEQRYYDPQIGRFLSVDPVTAYSDPADAFNRYWYANNNPYRFTDPDGRAAKDELKPPPPPVQDMARVTAIVPESRSGQAASVITLGTVRVVAERAAPAAVSLVSPMVGATVAAPFLLIATPHPCDGTNCGECDGIRCGAMEPLTSKGGKQNIRDSGLTGISPEEIGRRLRDPNTSTEERKRLQKQEKALGTRHNSQKK